MRKNLLIALAVLIGIVISMTACLLGDDIETLERKASEANIGITINIAKVEGVTAPATGRSPVTSIDNEQYTGTVTWLPNVSEHFEPLTQYTATITLIEKKGYTLNLVEENFFTVAGATATNSKNSGVITAIFPTTSANITPIAADYYISGLGPFTYNGSSMIVSINARPERSNGTITIKYDGSTIAPSNAGVYDVTFDVAEVPGFNPAIGLPAGTLTINKATGAAVNTPTLYTKNHNSIILNNQENTYTGQTVEYAINTSDTEPSTGWQASAIFSSLTEGTTYYIFARAAENDNYLAGMVISGLQAITPLTVSINRIEYYWVDQHDSLVTSSDGVNSIITGSTLTITSLGHNEGYVIKKWYVNGVDTGQSGYEYIFSIKTIGKHTVDLFLEKDNKLYSTSINITVTSNVLTANTWADSALSPSISEQWFKFTATDSTQYIHVSFGTLYSYYGLYVEVYDSNGSIGSPTNLTSSYTYTSYSLTSGQTYYIRVTPLGYSGTYRIAFNMSSSTPVTIPSNVTTLTANTWTNGNIAASSDEQWFKFTATASKQYIHVSFGTLTYLNIQIYDSTNSMIGETSLNNIIELWVTYGQTYYIRVMPYNSSYSGTYQITFNTSDTPPLPSNSATATALTANTWTNGNITTSNDEQWFKFTATDYTQYIHVSIGTLTDLYIQVYDSTGNIVGSRAYLYSSNRYTSRSVTNGEMYYIRIMPYNSNYSGTYQITFNTSNNPPLPSNSATATTLTVNTWANGNITASSDEEWFKFTATDSTHYIHASFGTLNYLKIQVYNSNGNTVGSQQTLYSSNRYTSLSWLISGETYYIRITQYSGYTGTYQITFNTSDTPPLPSNSATATRLTVNTWANGNITTSSDEKWFKFTATNYTQYIHFDLQTYFNIIIYDSNGSACWFSSWLSSMDTDYAISIPVTYGQEYYIRITSYYGSTGTYRIVFNTSWTRP